MIESGLGLLLLRGNDIELALFSIERRPRPALRRPRFLMVCVSLFETLAGSKMIRAQCSIPVEVSATVTVWIKPAALAESVVTSPPI